MLLGGAGDGQRRTSQPLLDVLYVCPSREILWIYEQMHVIPPAIFYTNDELLYTELCTFLFVFT